MYSSGKNSGDSPGKPNFTQTCNLLSQYIKERRNLHFHTGLATVASLQPKGNEICRPPPAVTLNLLSNFNNSPESPPAAASASAAEVFTQLTGSSSAGCIEEASTTTKPDLMKPRRETAPMTIFYKGRVFLFNDFPTDKAKEVVALAGRGSSTTTRQDANNDTNMGVDVNKPQQRPVNVQVAQPLKQRPSLTRFFEKRKQRIAAKAPYQLSSKCDYESPN